MPQAGRFELSQDSKTLICNDMKKGPPSFQPYIDALYRQGL